MVSSHSCCATAHQDFVFTRFRYALQAYQAGAAVQAQRAAAQQAMQQLQVSQLRDMLWFRSSRTHYDADTAWKLGADPSQTSY